MRKKMLELEKGERIISVFAKEERGPGWVNWPVYIVIQGNDGLCRVECLQPHQQNKGLKLLYRISEEINRKMIHLVQDIIRENELGRKTK